MSELIKISFEYVFQKEQVKEQKFEYKSINNLPEIHFNLEQKYVFFFN